MAKVKCKITGEKINKSESFSVIVEGYKNPFYFKSEKEYNFYVQEKLAEENVILLFNRILNKNKYSQLSRIIKNKLKIWLEDNYIYQEIEFTLKHNFELLSNVKIKGEPYLVTVIENKLLESKEVFLKNNKIENKKTKIEIDDEIENKINKSSFKYERRDITNWI